MEAAKILLEADSNAIHSRDSCGRIPGDCIPTNSSHSLHSLFSQYVTDMQN